MADSEEISLLEEIQKLAEGPNQISEVVVPGDAP